MRQSPRPPERLKLFPVLVLLVGCMDGVGEDDESCTSGCGVEGTCGDAGVLRFADASDDAVLAEGDAPMLPVAVGGRFDVRLFPAAEGSSPVSPATAETSGDAFMVDGVDDLVHLRALAAGTSHLEVETEDGLADGLDLEARPLDAVRIRSAASIFTASTLTVNEPVSMTSELALLPGARVNVSALLMDANDTVLGGHGIVSWASSDASVVDLAPAGVRSDAVVLEALALGVTTLEVTGWDALELAVVDVAEVQELTLYEPLIEEPESLRPWDGPIELEVEGESAVVALAHDAMQRVVVAPDGDPFVFSTSGDAGTIEIENAGWPNAFVIRAVAPGDASVDVDHLGLQASVAVEVR